MAWREDIGRPHLQADAEAGDHRGRGRGVGEGGSRDAVCTSGLDWARGIVWLASALVINC